MISDHLRAGSSLPPGLSHLPSSNRVFASTRAPCWAVLSFIPDDIAWCDWIYGELQGHEVPVLLTGLATPDGFALPEYLTAFPDRFDPDHFERYPEALATSRYLIVVCTPESAHAPEIDAQIRVFKKAGGEARIIVLLAQREPHAGQEKWPRAAECGWLPPWLRWRFGDDGTFAAADRSEPQIVDARPGWASLDEVKIALIAALLEISAAELEELENAVAPAAPTRTENPGVRPVCDSPIDDESIAVSTERAPAIGVETSPPGAPLRPAKATHRALIAGVSICILAGVATAWFSTRPPGQKPPAFLASPAPDFSAQSEKIPEVMVSRPPADPVIASESATPPFVPPPIAVPPPPDPIEVPPAEFLGPPPPTSIQLAAADELRMSAEKSGLAELADSLVLRHDFPLALETYIQALASAKRYAGRRSGDSATQTDIALLFRKIGSLHAQLDSTAEARQAFEQARKILAPIHAKGRSSKDRAKILEDAERGLRALPRD